MRVNKHTDPVKVTPVHHGRTPETPETAEFQTRLPARARKTLRFARTRRVPITWVQCGDEGKRRRRRRTCVIRKVRLKTRRQPYPASPLRFRSRVDRVVSGSLRYRTGVRNQLGRTAKLSSSSFNRPSAAAREQNLHSYETHTNFHDSRITAHGGEKKATKTENSTVNARADDTTDCAQPAPSRTTHTRTLLQRFRRDQPVDDAAAA